MIAEEGKPEDLFTNPKEDRTKRVSSTLSQLKKKKAAVNYAVFFAVLILFENLFKPRQLRLVVYM